MPETLEPSAELTALVDRLESLAERFEGCAIRLLNPQPGDTIVLECPFAIREAGQDQMSKNLAEVWPNNKTVILGNGIKLAGVRGKQSAITEAAINLFSGEYANLRGNIILPGYSDRQQKKLRALRESLKAAGYEWEELT